MFSGFQITHTQSVYMVYLYTFTPKNHPNLSKFNIGWLGIYNFEWEISCFACQKIFSHRGTASRGAYSATSGEWPSEYEVFTSEISTVTGVFLDRFSMMYILVIRK